MKVMITGGAGFIGSALVRFLIGETEAEVVNVDKLTYAGNPESLASVSDHPRYRFERADIADARAMQTLFARHRPEAVMHLAAESHVDRSIHGPGDFVHTNLVGTYTLLEAARAYWEQLPERTRTRFRFLHVSTDEVYGDLAEIETPGTQVLFTEESPYVPSSPYSASKAGSDHLVRAWHRTYGLPVLVTNCSNNYGPFQFPEKLIPLMILNALEGRPLPVYGDGQQVRDWLYVEDHVRALWSVLSDGETGETYNIGGWNEKTNLEVVQGICEQLEVLAPNKPDGIENYGDLVTFIRDRPGHDRRYAIDATKIARELGWRPRETFETGLAKTLRWYLDNDEWIDHVRTGAYRQWMEKHYA